MRVNVVLCVAVAGCLSFLTSAAVADTGQAQWLHVSKDAVDVHATAASNNRALIIARAASVPTTSARQYAVIIRRDPRRTKLVRLRSLPQTLGEVVAVQSDARGRWIILSRPQTGPALVTRLTAAGNLDVSFAVGGSASLTTNPIAIEVDHANRPVILGDAGPAANGSTTTVLTRLTQAGTVDSSFGVAGTAAAGPDMDAAATRLGVPKASIIVTPRSIAITKSSGVVVSGAVIDPLAGSLGFLTALNQAGAAQATFGSGGTVIYGPKRSDPLRPGELGRFVEVDPLFGNILTLGQATADDRSVIWRRTAHGARYGDFGVHGWLRLIRLARPVAFGMTCRMGPVVADERTITAFTRVGQPERRFGVSGTIKLRTDVLLDHLDVADIDQTACALFGVAARTRAGSGGIAVKWFTLPA